MSKITITGNKIHYSSIGSLAVNVLRKWIIEGKCPPGMRLTEEKLANDFGVSRACIREALMTLEDEGLVRKIRNKYTEVKRFEEKDAEDVLMLRYAIETLSAEICIKKDIVPLGKLEEQVRKIAAITAGGTKSKHNIRKYIEADLDFHEIIVYTSQNKLSVRAWNSLRNQMKVLLFLAINSSAANFESFGVKNHSSIVRAFASSDIKRVASLLREHIDSVLSLFVEILHKK